jgi:hypothetical protein
LRETKICSSSSAHRRVQEWVRAGVFAAFWRQGLLAYDALRGIDWTWLALDGAMGKAPLGGEKRMARPVCKLFPRSDLASLRQRIRRERQALRQDGDPRVLVLIKLSASQRHFSHQGSSTPVRLSGHLASTTRRPVATARAGSARSADLAQAAVLAAS